MNAKVHYFMEGFDPKLPPGDYPAVVTVHVRRDGIDITVRPAPPSRARARRHVTTNVRPVAGPNPYEHI